MSDSLDQKTIRSKEKKALEFEFLRKEIIGLDSCFSTPFGERLLVYCDYTASGRSLRFVEEYLMRLQRTYANTHTEDDITGRSTTLLLHQAEQYIKDSVNAGPYGKIIACGTGATGAIDKFQQLIGTALPPATRQTLLGIVSLFLEEGERFEEFEKIMEDRRPVVFVGPYEHHSNEITWREGLATVVRVKITADGEIDLEDLEQLLKDPAYEKRLRIGSFSAASNVTGLITPVHDVARLLHRYRALACFDYAASAPYVTIDMNPPVGVDGDSSLDAVFISPHKFLGGPGSSGVLVFNEQIYRKELSPSVGGGGTVDYVGLDGYDFIEDIEKREKAGTPGTLQIMRASLVFQIKDSVGVENIERREQQMLQLAFQRWLANPNIKILGNPNPSKRLGIVSFLVQDPGGRQLHPKFLTSLLNDLFGIQSRAGCSCAGPYGHHLLNIDQAVSEKYRSWIDKGCYGIKPGWCRVCFHYVMDDPEVHYIIEAVDFIGHHGHLFLPLYGFDLRSGLWTHKNDQGPKDCFSLETALQPDEANLRPLSARDREKEYERCLREACEFAEKLEHTASRPATALDGELRELQFFSIYELSDGR